MKSLVALLLTCLCCSAQMLRSAAGLASLNMPTASEEVAPSSLVTNLVAYWRFDESSGMRYDAVGTNHLWDLSAVGAVSGVFTNCLNLVSNSTDYLTLTNNDTCGVSNRSLTLALWFRCDVQQWGVLRYIGGKYGVGGGREYMLDISPANQLRMGLSTNTVATGQTAASGAALNTNVWYFGVGMFDFAARQIIVSVDAANWVTNTFPVLALTNTATYFSFGRVGGSGTYFWGNVDEAGLWHRCLTRAEVDTLYNSGAGRTHPFQ